MSSTTTSKSRVRRDGKSRKFRNEAVISCCSDCDIVPERKSIREIDSANDIYIRKDRPRDIVRVNFFEPACCKPGLGLVSLLTFQSLSVLLFFCNTLTAHPINNTFSAILNGMYLRAKLVMCKAKKMNKEHTMVSCCDTV